MWTKLAGFILRYRTVLLITVCVITLGMLYQAKDVHLSYEYASLLPEKDSAFIEYEKFKEHFGEDANIMFIAIKDKNFFELDKFNCFMDLSDSLSKIEGIEGVFSVANAFRLKGSRLTKFFEEKPQSQYELDSISSALLQQELYKGFLFNDTSHVYMTALTINKPLLDSPAREQLLDSIISMYDEYTASNNQEVFYSGLPYIRTKTSLKIQGELMLFVILAALICSLILYMFFRSIKIVFFAMLIVAFGVVWVMGWMGIFNYDITILNALLPPLIIVIGVPNSVFFLNKYHHEYVLHGNKIKALQRVIRKIGNATFLTNLTTASGFATFIITESRILQEFGLVAFLGILSVFVLSLLLIPIVFSYLDPPNKKQVRHLDNKFFQQIIKLLTKTVLNYRPFVYVGFFILFAVGIWGVTKMESTGYMVDDLPHNDPILTNLKFIEREFNGALPLEILVHSDSKINVLQNRSFLLKMERLSDSLKKYPEISKPLSILELIKFSWQAHNGGDPDYYTLHNSIDFGFQNKMNRFVRSQNNKMQYSIVDSTNTSFRVKCNVKDVGTERMEFLTQELQTDLDSIFVNEKYSTTVTGSSIVFFKGTKYLIRNLFISLFLAIIIIAVFMAWMFRSKRMVVVALLPNILPLILTAALMGFFNIPIKPSTILVFSIAFGISVDDTIHFLAKYRQELRITNWNIGKSVVLALKETGTSMIYTSIILFFGFGIFIASQFGGTEALGSLVAITLLIAMLSNLIVLPSLLLTLEKQISNQSFKEPLLHIYNEEDDIEIDDLKIISQNEDDDDDETTMQNNSHENDK
ncbi:MAG: MMPL family transporter [Bacteroidales bacterium]|jgi:predicted RND superfamily exporter protein|nr:MMPL family transporter [Bacteroidales bacterium]